jgi:hypothetical protein
MLDHAIKTDGGVNDTDDLSLYIESRFQLECSKSYSSHTALLLLFSHRQKPHPQLRLG